MRRSPPLCLPKTPSPSWGDFVECHEIVAREGRVAKGKGGAPYAHPAVGMMTNARNCMVKYAAELGMSPTSRPKIHAHKPAKKAVSKKDKWARPG